MSRSFSYIKAFPHTLAHAPALPPHRHPLAPSTDCSPPETSARYYTPRRTYYYFSAAVLPPPSLVELHFWDRLSAFYFSDLG